MGKLTAIAVKQLKKTGLHSDSDGLYLKVQTSSDPEQPNKSWIYRWGAGGKNSIGLGSLKDVSLAEARDQAAEYRRQVRKGIDPRTERNKLRTPAQEVMTFQKAAELFIASKGDGWKNKKHAQQWTNTLKTYAYPLIGDIPCSEVTTEHIVDILRPIWSTKNETATRVRGRIENVMDWASVMGQRSGENPARWKGKLQVLLPTISKRRRIKHHPAMPYLEVPALFKTIGANPILSAQALIFCILTATRTSETIEAKWSEFDFEKELWVIPKDRMKKEKEHRVPLSPQAIDLLKSITRIDGSPYVFNGRSRRKDQVKVPQPLSNAAMMAFLQGTLGHTDLTVHGFRSSFRDWAGETTDHKREVIEQALSHSLVDQAEAAYQRGDYMDKRKLLMSDWADYCYSINK
ncbi:phage integrase central domain-containing protein [Zwartia sp.]|uniref:tyrosine-type recombinase/integrase n=1 Tax=Zwartia sp. TaxID=2978004 RepID=UPI0027202491|nr:integrase arm-type DNA-binding domain-containing protein [Zwartia sp.]MDO9025288.1 integrase arm-type DNA-binding domain-containing protein [Zwartia sp.]